ncbi:peptidylprolyl isomerase [Mycolicibacterium sp. XJ1819]
MTTPAVPPSGHPPPYGYPPPRPTNALAIAALVCAFLFAPLGIVFGHVSLSQIKKSGEEGRGLAVAGLIIGYAITALTAVVIAIAVLLFVVFAGGVQSAMKNQDNSSWTESKRPLSYYLLPAFDPPGVPGANCQYPATTEPADKPVKPPRSGKIPTDRQRITAQLSTNEGDIGLTLDNQKSPCTVNNFESLARQGFFDNTTCHRLTTEEHLGVLQCGDPSGTGDGGPGYRFPNEYPSNQYKLTDPILKSPSMMYPRGTLAMANTGQGTNGSQFFLVYKDSILPASYTVFGTVDDAGLATVDKIAEAGVAGGAGDGKPTQDLTIESVRVG